MGFTSEEGEQYDGGERTLSGQRLMTGSKQASPVSGQAMKSLYGRVVKDGSKVNDEYVPPKKKAVAKTQQGPKLKKEEKKVVEVKMRPLEQLVSTDPTKIFCFGDNVNLLKLEVGPMTWFKVPVDTDKVSQGAFDGTLRYASACFIPPMPDEKIVVTGGCFSTNGFPSNSVVEFTLKSLRKPTKKRPMLLKRYGHVSAYLNGLLYCIGGFSHKDLANEQPVTLSACERFSVTAEKQWSHVSSLCEARAFGSAVTFSS